MSRVWYDLHQLPPWICIRTLLIELCRLKQIIAVGLKFISNGLPIIISNLITRIALQMIKNNSMKVFFLITSLTMAFMAIGCKEESGSVAEDQIFPKGKKGHAENFTGAAWNYDLVPNDSIFNTVAGNVYFEPGARSNWHLHPAGQILIITGGVGFHQIQGEPRQVIRKGDVVKCPPNVLHWHGASADTGMQQMYIIPNTEKGIVEWKQSAVKSD